MCPRSPFNPGPAPSQLRPLSQDLPCKDLILRVAPMMSYFCLPSTIGVGALQLNSKPQFHTQPAVWSYRPTLHFDKSSFYFPLKQLFGDWANQSCHACLCDNLFQETLLGIQQTSPHSSKDALDRHQNDKVWMIWFFPLLLSIQVRFPPNIPIFQL